MKREKVTQTSKVGPAWSNSYEARLSCGHVVIVNARKGILPKTATCWRCRHETLKKGD